MKRECLEKSNYNLEFSTRNCKIKYIWKLKEQKYFYAERWDLNDVLP